MHAMHRRQLADRLVAFDCRQRHLSLERCAMGLPFPRHGYPFLGQPTVAYSTVQFLGSTSIIVGCTPCTDASSLIVLSPLTAANATWALNAALWDFRFRAMVTPFLDSQQ